MKTLLLAILLLASVTLTIAGDTVFREPFTLKLHIDHDHSFTKRFGKMPFVLNGNVYIFKGEDFGIDLDIQNDVVGTVSYQPEVKEADVQLNFTQEIEPDGTAMMMLTILNNTKYSLNFDALMTVPEKKSPTKTKILPVKPGQSELTSWPHPVVQILLRNIRIAK